ncbi:hypothetical protein Ancab_016631 [Ancistrocladus abbreviatus]
MSVSAIFGARMGAAPTLISSEFGAGGAVKAVPTISGCCCGGSGSGGMVIECSSRPKKKATAHHMKTRPRKTQAWDIRRRPTVYPPLPPLPPDWTLVASEEAAPPQPPPASPPSPPSLESESPVTIEVYKRMCYHVTRPGFPSLFISYIHGDKRPRRNEALVLFLFSVGQDIIAMPFTAVQIARVHNHTDISVLVFALWHLSR